MCASERLPLPELYFSVLGPLRGWLGQTELALGSPQQRATLAALLLRQGHVATVGQLVDAVWGQEPPPTAVRTVRTYISRLRLALGGALRRRWSCLESVGAGYRLPLDSGALDLDVFQRRVADAEIARSAGDLFIAADLLHAALRMWPSVTLVGVPGPFAEQQRDRLSEIRLAVLGRRLGLDLDLGRHACITADLTVLTSEYPMRERFRELLMLALYRSGRQAEALAVYQETRRLLAGKLGIEPGPALQDLQQRILAADPDLGAPTRAAS